MKKKKSPQQEKLENEDDDSDAEPILANPNIAAGKKLAISDIGSVREPTRRERYCMPSFVHASNDTRMYREEIDKKEAKERYWKVFRLGGSYQNTMLIVSR